MHTLTHLSKDLISFSEYALLHLSPPALLRLPHATVPLGQQREGVDSALLLQVNQPLGQGVKQVLELGAHRRRLRRLLQCGLRAETREDVLNLYKVCIALSSNTNASVCLTWCREESLCSVRVFTSSMSAFSSSCSSFCRVFSVLTSWMRFRWFSLPLNIC